MRRAQTHVGRRSPTEATKKHHRRAKRQLSKLNAMLKDLQRRLLERGASTDGLARLAMVLDPLDATLRATQVSESRTRVFKRVRKAAKRARHALNA
ncbi:MAG: hypothetical protein AAGA48_12495 [Myxococcota bacterium]